MPRPRDILVVSFITLVALTLAACAPSPPPPPRPVIVYGDSLVTESREAIERRVGAAFPGRAVHIRAVGGTAQCDFHHQMNADASLRPEAVVIAFFGNRLTQCVATRPFPASYEHDARWAVQTWRARGVDPVLIGAPPPVGQTSNPTAEAYRRVATELGAPFGDSRPHFVDAGGRAASHRACWPGEGPGRGCADGTIQIRHTDGGHLCPRTTEPSGRCPGYSPGAERYAETIAQALRGVIR